MAHSRITTLAVLLAGWGTGGSGDIDGDVGPTDLASRLAASG